MKIGIVSDSHGKAKQLRRALAILTERGAEAIVHCGDLGSAECIRALAQTHLPAYAVAGNTDGNGDSLQAAADKSGVHFGCKTVQVPIDGQACLVATHGNDAEIMARLMSDENIHYLCHGHTHLPRDERIAEKHIINPGALRHAHPATAAILDTDADTVEHVEVW